MQELIIQEGLMPYQDGRQLLSETEPKINDSSIEDIKSSLRYALIKIGIKNNQLPDDFEKAILIEHVRQHYKFLSVSDIRRAFDLASAGKLDEDPNPYGTFSCVYLSKILNSYLRWVSNNPKPDKIMSEITDKPNEEAMMNEWIEALKKMHIENRLTVQYAPISVYDYLKKVGKIRGTWDDIKKAANIRRADLLKDCQSAEGEKKFKDFVDGLDIRKVIIEEQKDIVLGLAKRVSLCEYIKTIVESDEHK